MKHLTLPFLLFIVLSAAAQGPYVRQEMRLDEVENQYGLTGKGVTIVIMDRGIDYTHPDFIDENGKTRIAYVYDMINPAGANDPNNIYGVGTIFDSTDINQALANNTDPPITMDRGGHGTATAGIAGGDGSGTQDSKYKGVAPGARFIIIEMVNDYFPAFGSQPQQNSFYDPSYIPIAFDFAADKITELGLPSATLMNIGSIGGPADGTSEISREIEAFIDKGNTFVCGVGDDGGADNHASATVPENDTLILKVRKGESYALSLHVWYSEEDRFSVSIKRPNGTVDGPYPAPTGPFDAKDFFPSGIQIYHRGANQEWYGATSNRRMLNVRFNLADTGTFEVILAGTEINATGQFNAMLNPSRYYNRNEFKNYVVPGYSINDFASTEKNIAPTDYVAKNEWTDINGIFRDLTGQGEDGELWAGSSEGPTQDGRLGVDFAGPGEVAFAAYSADSWYGNFPHNKIQGGNGLYGVQNAVSAIAPAITGLIALMLEVNPNLTPAEIKSIMQSSCNADAHTGTVPNATWGYGKIDAMQVIQNTMATVGIDDRDSEEPMVHVYPNPATDRLYFRTASGEIKITGVSVINIQGQMLSNSVFSMQHGFDVSFLAEGLYLIQVETNRGIVTNKILKH